MESASVSAARHQMLLLEDDPGVRRSMQLVFQGQGYDVRAFASGEALLGDARAVQAACLIADYALAGKDGISVLSSLRSAGWQGPALLVSAFATPDLERRARQAGFAEIFEKPVKLHLLVDALERARVGQQAPDIPC